MTFEYTNSTYDRYERAYGNVFCAGEFGSNCTQDVLETCEDDNLVLKCIRGNNVIFYWQGLAVRPWPFWHHNTWLCYTYRNTNLVPTMQKPCTKHAQTRSGYMVVTTCFKSTGCMGNLVTTLQLGLLLLPWSCYKVHVYNMDFSTDHLQW